MSWRNNSSNHWKSRQASQIALRYQFLAALLLLVNLIVVAGCIDGGAKVNDLKDDRSIIDEGETGTMKSESADKRDIMPAIDQNLPAGLETATLALG